MATTIWSSCIAGAEAAVKKWRSLINIHKLWLYCGSCRSPPCHQFTHVHVRTVPYCAARMLNQLRRGHRVWPMFELKSGAAMAAPAAPMPPPLHRLHNHVYFLMSCLLWSYWSKRTLLGKYRVVNLNISLTAITFHQVSPNSMAVPKPSLLHLKRRPQRTFSQKLIWIKTSFFKKPKVKVHWWWPLTRPLWDVLDKYAKWKRILWSTSGENCRPKC